MEFVKTHLFRRHNLQHSDHFDARDPSQRSPRACYVVTASFQSDGDMVQEGKSQTLVSGNMPRKQSRSEFALVALTVIFQPR